MQSKTVAEVAATQTARDASNALAAEWRRQIRHALRHFQLRPSERQELAALTSGLTERTLASNTKLRVQSTKILIDRFSALARAGARTPHRRYWHVNFLGPLINEYRPELDLDAYRQVVDRLIRSQSLNAVFSIELQSLTNYPQKGFGRSFLLNAHALVWTDDTAFNDVAAADVMQASQALTSEFGARTVTFTPRSDFEGIVYLAHYLTKLPTRGKRRRRDPENKGRWQLWPVAKVRSDLQLRLAELLSHLEITDLVWGVLDGKKVRGAWKRAITSWNKDHCRNSDPVDVDFDVGALWQTIRDRPGNGSRLYLAPLFFGQRPRRLPSETWPRHGGKRIWPHQAKVRFELPVQPPIAQKTDLDDPPPRAVRPSRNRVSDLDDL